MAQAAAPKHDVYSTLAVPAPFDTKFSLVTSPVVSPLVLAVIRLTLATYGLAFIIVRLVHEGAQADESFFSYFTSLSYIGLMCYFWAAGVQTLCFALSREHRYPLQAWPRPLQFLHLLLTSTVLSLPIVVTAVFWSLLSGPGTLSPRYNAWVNISEHALNTAFAALEILFSNIAPRSATNPDAVGLPWIHLPFVLLILACYLGLAYVTHATQGFYTYDFLNPQTEHAKLAAYIIGIAVAGAVVFIVVRYICLLRSYLFIRYTHTPAKRFSTISEEDIETKGHGGKGEVLEEWEEVRRPSASTAAGVRPTDFAV